VMIFPRIIPRGNLNAFARAERLYNGAARKPLCFVWRAQDVTLTCGARCVCASAPLEKESRSLKFYFESSSVRKKDLLPFSEIKLLCADGARAGGRKSLGGFSERFSGERKD
jgi:hypothetical protein